ncbi:MAG: DUF3842 family protein [Armatimonadota bacterium]|nr:DUF3842 family protein [Armatimonadota bacterium]
MKIAIIDGMGGGIGSQVVARLKQILRREDTLIALGTNAAATGSMVKSGADVGATGENAIVVTAPTADIIVGPVGIVIPNSLLGEISPNIATAIASCKAIKILIPLTQPHVELIGLEARPLSATLDDVASRVQELLK